MTDKSLIESFIDFPEFTVIAEEGCYRLEHLSSLPKNIDYGEYSSIYINKNGIDARRVVERKKLISFYIPRDISTEEYEQQGYYDDDYGDETDFYCKNDVYILYKNNELKYQFVVDNPGIFLDENDEVQNEICVDDYIFLEKFILKAIETNKLIPFVSTFAEYLNTPDYLKEKITNNNISNLFIKDSFINLDETVFQTLIEKLTENNISKIVHELSTFEVVKNFIERIPSEKRNYIQILNKGAFHNSLDLVKYAVSNIPELTNIIIEDALSSCVFKENIEASDYLLSLKDNLNLEKALIYAVINKRQNYVKYLLPKMNKSSLNTVYYDQRKKLSSQWDSYYDCIEHKETPMLGKSHLSGISDVLELIGREIRNRECSK